MAVSRSTPRPRRRTRTWWRRWPTWTPSSPHSARPLAPARPATTITARNRVHPPERLRRFPLLSTRYALREGGRRQRGGAALAWRPLLWATPVSEVICKIVSCWRLPHKRKRPISHEIGLLSLEGLTEAQLRSLRATSRSIDATRGSSAPPHRFSRSR